MTRRSYRALVLSAMPGTRAEIEAKTGLAHNTIWRWVKDLHESNECHIARWARSPKGPHTPVFVAGAGKDATNKLEYLTLAERSERFRKKARADGRWDKRLSTMRARHWAERAKKKGDPLINALFGRTQS